MDCVAQGSRTTRQPVTVAGARLSRTPIVVPVLIALNLLAHLVTSMQAGSPMDNFRSALFTDWVMNPALVATGEWWRLVTSGFLHIGLVHLLINMVALWVVGRDLELLLGRVRFIAVYVLSMLGGSLFVFLLDDPGSRVAGASTALYGLFGGVAVAAWRLKLNLRPILMVIGINILLTLSIPGISLLGHLGGLVLGAASTAALVYAPAQRRNAWQFGALAALFLVVVAAILTRDAMIGDTICGNFPAGNRCYRLE